MSLVQVMHGDERCSLAPPMRVMIFLTWTLFLQTGILWKRGVLRFEYVCLKGEISNIARIENQVYPILTDRRSLILGKLDTRNNELETQCPLTSKFDNRRDFKSHR